MKSLFIIAAIVACFISCKKNNEEKKDIKTLFNSTTWTGEAKYTARSVAEPFCVRFDATGNFAWYELDGEYGGKFTTDNDKKTITLTFSGGTMVIGTVADDNKLTDLKYGATYPWTVKSFEFNKPETGSLDLTTWKGSSKIGLVPQRSLTISFKPGNILDFKETYTSGSVSEPNRPYTVDHAAIKFKTFYGSLFGVFKDGKIIGIEKSSTTGLFSTFQVSK